MNCKNCNAVMRVDKEKKLFVCPYCDSVEPFNSFSNQELKEELKGIVSEAIRDANQGKSGSSAADQGSVYRDSRTKAQKTKDLVITVVQIIFCFILGFFSILIFADEGQIAGFISLTQLILLIAAMSNKSKFHRTGKEKARKTAKICTIAASLLILAWIGVVVASVNDTRDSIIGKEAKWPSSGIGSQLPKLPGKIDYAYSNKTEFNAYSKGNFAADYDAYVEECKKAGFDIDIEATNTKFLAYDKDDNKLEIDYWEHSDKINVRLEKAIVMGDFQWYNQGIAGEIPEPKAEKSYLKQLQNDSYERFEIYVGDVTSEEFMNYVSQCMADGFTGNVKDNKFSGSKERSGAAEQSKKKYIRLDVELLRGRILFIEAYGSDY